ncbi:MAG: cupin domain-containing protein [Pseudomonadota bacterium]
METPRLSSSKRALGLVGGANEKVGVSGRLDLWLGERHIVLEAGDSFAFASSEPHRYANLSAEETVVIWAISPPSY